MSRVIEAVYEGGVLRLKDPVPLSEGQTVRVILPDAEAAKPRDDRLRRHFGVWRSGDANSADNARIDADLARSYAGAHEPEV